MYFSDYETLRLPGGYPLARGKRNGNYISVGGRLGEAPPYTPWRVRVRSAPTARLSQVSQPRPI